MVPELVVLVVVVVRVRGVECGEEGRGWIEDRACRKKTSEKMLIVQEKEQLT